MNYFTMDMIAITLFLGVMFLYFLISRSVREDTPPAQKNPRA